MKKLLNIFYIGAFKFFVVLALLLLSLQMSLCFSANIKLYKQNPAAMLNVFSQPEGFKYETSEFLKKEIKTAIDSVLQYSLYYHRSTPDTSPLTAKADDNYKEILNRFEGYKSFYFAVVNHDTERIISNLHSINLKSSGTAVRKYFPESEDFLMIIRNARTPYYVNGTMTDYTEYVTSLAETYSDDFDLYMFFGENFCFSGNEELYRQSHEATAAAAAGNFYKAVTTIAVIIPLAVVLFLICGKAHKGGRVYPGVTDKIPNDLKLLLYLIVYISMSALYENSIYMFLRAESLEFWINYSPEYYLLRSHISMLVSVCIILATGCTLKRQIRTGTLLSNTYLYKYYRMWFRKSE